jgi:predicted ATPase
MLLGHHCQSTEKDKTYEEFTLEIQAIKISNFKRSKDIEIVTPQLSVVVGGNNSGKSSLLQGIHFAVTILQSAKSSAANGKAMNTLGYDQFLYRPAGDLIALHHQTPITSKAGAIITLT